MITSAADTEEAVDAVLQDAVLAAEQSISTFQDPGLEHPAVSSEPGVHTHSERQSSSSADQVQGQSQTPETLRADGARGAAALPHVSPVSSAINPLFQPSQPYRPRSAQLQQTLSSLTKQLSDLEASMQSPQTADAAVTDSAASSHRPEPSTSDSAAIASSAIIAGASPSRVTGNSNISSNAGPADEQLPLAVEDAAPALPIHAAASAVDPVETLANSATNTAPAPLSSATAALTDIAATDAPTAFMPAIAAAELSAAGWMRSLPRIPASAATDPLPASAFMPATAEAEVSAAEGISPLPHILASAATDSLPASACMPATSEAEVSAAEGMSPLPHILASAATDSLPASAFTPIIAEAELSAADWMPSPPQNPAVRPVAPRRSASLRHSTSAIPDQSQHNAPAYRNTASQQILQCSSLKQHSSDESMPEGAVAGSLDEQVWRNDGRGFTMQQPVTDAVAGSMDEEVWRNDGRGFAMQRPVTAGNARSKQPMTQSYEGGREFAMQRPVTAGSARSRQPMMQSGEGVHARRPQTAFPAAQAWRSKQRASWDSQKQPLEADNDEQGGWEVPLSPARQRMRHAVERESCLRLEAEMAALDLDELLHQKAAAQTAAQDAAKQNVQLHEELQEVRQQLHAALHDASRQHARQLQLQLQTEQMTAAALQRQLREAQQEAEAQRRRGNAAELALQSERRQRRSAEHARSRPTSPLKDTAQHSELAGLRHQVADLSGRLQQSEQTNADLLAHLAQAMQPSQQRAAAAKAASGQEQLQTTLEMQQGLASQQQHGALQNIRTDAAKDLFDSSDEDEQQLSASCSSDRQSSGHQAESASPVKSKPPQGGQQTLQDISNSQQPNSAGPGAVAHSSVDAAKMHSTLQALAETLAVDVVRLKQLLEGRSSVSAAAVDIKAANWGFPKPALDNSPEPSRPVTAGPCDSTHRLNRQWSAGSAQHRTGQQSQSEHHLRSSRTDQQSQSEYQPRASRPATAGNQYGADAAGVPFYAAAGRYNGYSRPGRWHKAEPDWQDPVPPTRMPEEILQQAREDYIREKNRVRDKRMQELKAWAADASVAPVA